MLHNNRIADAIIVAGLIFAGAVIAHTFVSDEAKPVGTCAYKIPVIPPAIDRE